MPATPATPVTPVTWGRLPRTGPRTRGGRAGGGPRRLPGRHRVWRFAGGVSCLPWHSAQDLWQAVQCDSLGVLLQRGIEGRRAGGDGRVGDHVSEHEFMFRACSWHQKHALCLRTWFHVHEHDFMFQNMISCFWTWIRVSKHVHHPKTCSMFKNMKSCSWTWFHVHEHDFMFLNMNSCFKACSSPKNMLYV